MFGAVSVVRVTFSLQGKSYLVFLYSSNKRCLKGWGIEGEKRKTHLEVVHQYGISPGACVTSAFFTFPQVSLEMVAMIAQWPQRKSSKCGSLLLFSLISSLLAVFPSNIVSLWMQSVHSIFCHIIFHTNRIPPFFWFLCKCLYLDYNTGKCSRDPIYISTFLGSLVVNYSDGSLPCLHPLFSKILICTRRKLNIDHKNTPPG